jgi:uncharacterized membrane protein
MCGSQYIKYRKYRGVLPPGPGGEEDNFPVNSYPGDSKPVIVDIANYDYRNVNYDLVVSLNDRVLDNTIYGECHLWLNITDR